MAVYLAGSSLTAAHQGQNLTPPEPSNLMLNLLGKPIVLPYFHALPQRITTLNLLTDLLLAHIQAAAQQAGWSAAQLSDTPIFLASTAYSISIHEQEDKQSGHYNLDRTAQLLRQHLGNPNIYSIATACTSAAQAIVQAAAQMENGLAQRAIVVGFECANRYTPSHFHAMQLLAEAPPYRPLHQANGIILGEACAALALSAQPVSGSLKLHAFQTRSDTRSFTNTDAAELEALIDSILGRAALTANDINCVKTHAAGGTGDADELALLQRRFAHSRHLALKAYTGHTLGATAAAETAWYARALSQKTLPAEICLHYYAGFGGSMAGWVSEMQT